MLVKRTAKALLSLAKALLEADAIAEPEDKNETKFSFQLSKHETVNRGMVTSPLELRLKVDAEAISKDKGEEAASWIDEMQGMITVKNLIDVFHVGPKGSFHWDRILSSYIAKGWIVVEILENGQQRSIKNASDIGTWEYDGGDVTTVDEGGYRLASNHLTTKYHGVVAPIRKTRKPKI